MAEMQTWQMLQEQQPLATKILWNSIKKNRISHAYLLQGTRGTGKKSLSILLAMTLLCESKSSLDPCQTCHICQRIKSGNHPDVHWIEPDGQTIKNDQIRLLRKEFNYTGFEQNRKIYIISGADLLTVNAANRILKFLEEPEQETTAILLTDNGQAILPTIRSRCQMIDLQPLKETAFQYRLIETEETTISESNARLLSALTNNIDEAIRFHQEEKVYHIRDLVQELIYIMLVRYDERYLFVHQKWLPLLKEKTEQELGLDLLLLACKDMINYQIGRKDKMFLFQREDGLLIRAVQQFSNHKLLWMTKEILETKQKMKQNIHPTLLMEQLVLNF